MRTEFKDAPAKACHFAAGPLMFAEGEASKDGNKPISMLARSAQPIDHWYWGRCVHDMSGMQLHKDVLPIDYEHEEPIGFLNQFDAGNDGLSVKGELAPTDEPDDRARRIIKLADRGVPYEASINFGGDGIVYEFINEGQVTQVNGYSFEGPGIVFRQWPLRGVAVCPYGADMNTESAFSRDEEKTFSLTRVTETPMKTGTKAATQLSDAAVADPPAIAPAADAQPTAQTPAAAPAADAQPSTDAPADELQAGRNEAKRFKDAFGEKGPLWFAEGLSFDDARSRQISELQAETADLRAKLSAAGAAPTGEQTPVGFQAADGKKFGGFASKIRILGQPATQQ